MAVRVSIAKPMTRRRWTAYHLETAADASHRPERYFLPPTELVPDGDWVFDTVEAARIGFAHRRRHGFARRARRAGQHSIHLGLRDADGESSLWLGVFPLVSVEDAARALGGLRIETPENETLTSMRFVDPFACLGRPGAHAYEAETLRLDHRARHHRAAWYVVDRVMAYCHLASIGEPPEWSLVARIVDAHVEHIERQLRRTHHT